MQRIIILALLATSAAGQALAQSSETERREACTGDAFKLCAAEIPDRERIRMCLQAHRDELSPDCRAVVTGGRPGSGR